MINEFLSLELDDMDVVDVYFQQDGATCHIQSVQQERILNFSKTIRDLKTFFFLNKSTLEGLRRYYLIDSPVPIVVQNGLAPFRHAFH